MLLLIYSISANYWPLRLKIDIEYYVNIINFCNMILKFIYAMIKEDNSTDATYVVYNYFIVT